MDKGLAIRKALVNLLCCFVPQRKRRKRLRYVLVDIKRRRKELVDLGFSIDDGVVTTPEGVRIDVSDTSDHPLYMIKEVFVKSEYNLNIGRDSVLIDIGMNRGAVSLRFAADDSIEKVYSYEPFKPTFEAARKNLNLNPGLSKKITAFNFGLGKDEATLELPYVATASGAMSTTHSVCGAGNAPKEKVVVKDAATEVGRILEENQGRCVIVKCDCEGAEFEIFERLNEEGVIGRIDVVMMEFHYDSPDRLVEVLIENNFAVQVKSGSSKSRTGYIYAVRMAERV